MKSETPWVVLTGAPSSGISTTLHLLQSHGYEIMREVAREILDDWQRQGLQPKAERLRHESEFQREILRRKVARERDLPRDRVVLFDRGVPDSVTYFRIHGLDCAEARAFCTPGFYRHVFFLEALPWEEDYARTEDPETRRLLAEGLYQDYVDLGYDMTSVPVMSADDRVRYILSRLTAIS